MIHNVPSTKRSNNHLIPTHLNDPSNQPRIKLTSVHSLQKSPKERLNSPATISLPYEQLLYHTGVYAEGDTRPSSLSYQSLTEALQGLSRSRQFSSLIDLQSFFNGKKRCLLLTSTNQKSLALVEVLSKKKTKINMILLGELKPTAEYLGEKIVLATSDPKQVIKLIKESGFDGTSLTNYTRRNSIELQSMSSSGFRQTMMNVMKESEESSAANIINRRSSNKEKMVHHWLVDKDPNGSFRTTEILNQRQNAERRVNQESQESEVRQYDEQIARELPLNQQEGSLLKKEELNNSKQYGNSHSNDKKDEVHVQRKNNQQKEIIPKEPMELPKIQTHDYPINPRVYRHFPSNIIPEVSDQYKGSVRQSIMNIEPDLSFKSTRQNYPSNLTTVNLQTQDDPTKKNINSIYRIESTNSMGPYPVRYNSTVLPPSHKTQQNGSKGQPTRIALKKEVTQPEEIISTSTIPAPLKQQATTVLINQQYVPATYRAINSNRVSQVVSPPTLTRQTYSSPINQLRDIASVPPSPQVNHVTTRVASPQTYASPPKDPRVTYSSNINWEEYEKVESNGRIVYRKKVNPVHTQIIKPVQIQSATSQRTFEASPRISNVNLEKTSQINIMKVQQTNKPTITVISSPKNTSSKEQILQSTLKPAPLPLKPSILQPLRQQSTNFPQLANRTTPKERNEPKSGSKPALLNESNMFSRMSELHSDGSILRRNNMRFGIKLPVHNEREPSFLESKLSGLYKAEGDRKNSVNCFLRGEQLEDERDRLAYVVTRFNCFHFLVQEDLGYLVESIRAHVATPNDSLDSFTGLQELIGCLRTAKDRQFDAGFIFLQQEELKLVNPALLPEDYYTVIIEPGEGQLLQIEETSKKMRIDQLGRLLLVQRIIVDSKLYQYVAYRSHNQDIALLADRFLNTEFILEQIETQFTIEILDFYYCQLPRLTRLYLLCEQEELPKLVRLVNEYKQINVNFNVDSCKVICLIGGILSNEAMIMAHPTVTFISNPEQINTYEDILRYAHHAEPEMPRSLPTDRIFFHRALQLQQSLEACFPGRFQVYSFGKLAEVYGRLEKVGKGRGQKNYLVLHESQAQQKVNVQRFNRVFLVGKIKSVQPQVARVLNADELLEVLGK